MINLHYKKTKEIIETVYVAFFSLHGDTPNRVNVFLRARKASEHRVGPDDGSAAVILIIIIILLTITVVVRRRT